MKNTLILLLCSASAAINIHVTFALFDVIARIKFHQGDSQNDFNVNVILVKQNIQ